MTNHSETTGSPENGDITGPEAQSGHNNGEQGEKASDASRLHGPGPAHDRHDGEHQVTLRTPAELADALPYLLGYRPEDSIVLVALHDRDGRGRFGGRARLGIPANADDWPSAARQLSHGLVTGSERRGARPESMVAFLCQEPDKGQTGRQVMERLRPLAQRLRVECGSLGVVVVEALCISEGRYWSYCCDNAACCSPDGAPMGLPGTSVLAAAATYAGIQVRGTLRELRARLLPWENAAALEQEAALDTASMALVPKILDEAGRAAVADETLELAGRVLDRFAEAQPVSGVLLSDLRDDELLGHDEAARLILGLQDRATRDRAAEWMEGDEAGRALRLWRALARRCVGPYGEHAAAPLTLAGWVAWSTDDELEAREALAMALGADPDYLFARLLHQACNEGLDPESIRSCLRAEREGRGSVGTDLLEARADGDASEECETSAARDLERHDSPSPVAAPPDLRPFGKPSRAVVPAGGESHDRPSRAVVPHEGESHDKPSPAGVPSRRRRRSRPVGTTGAAPGRTGAEDRDTGARTPRRRTPAGTAHRAGATETGPRPGRAATAGTARPGSVRTGGTRARTSKKAAMPCRDTGQEGVLPGHSTDGEE
ncbi:hypothetical protein UK15_11640 [Streptomyces variegatus]|uniref:DUF4192 domain-containing protein n=1 Tax=Streptomyces variegatus TaxID=284040 RepID=A0A0M2GPD4_9ACTN|nr:MULTISPECIES: DUF4192 domain-containing protein [Streptomyces]KJK39670.1 hypothetical protein UK15_11640 [Streptomyces variegatus]